MWIYKGGGRLQSMHQLTWSIHGVYAVLHLDLIFNMLLRNHISHIWLPATCWWIRYHINCCKLLLWVLNNLYSTNVGRIREGRRHLGNTPVKFIIFAPEFAPRFLLLGTTGLASCFMGARQYTNLVTNELIFW